MVWHFSKHFFRCSVGSEGQYLQIYAPFRGCPWSLSMRPVYHALPCKECLWHSAWGGAISIEGKSVPVNLPIVSCFTGTYWIYIRKSKNFTIPLPVSIFEFYEHSKQPVILSKMQVFYTAPRPFIKDEAHDLALPICKGLPCGCFNILLFIAYIVCYLPVSPASIIFGVRHIEKTWTIFYW